MSTATQLRFKNIEPTEAHKEILLKALEDIEEVSPDEAVVKARLKKRGKGFVANVRVYSGKAFFKAQVTGKNVKEMAAQLRNNLLHQMERWKEAKRHKRHRQTRAVKRAEKLRLLEKNFIDQSSAV